MSNHILREEKTKSKHAIKKPNNVFIFCDQ